MITRGEIYMIITNIKKSKKGNILLYADNNYLTSVSLEVFVKSKIKIGDYIDEEILSKIDSESNNYKAKEKALRLLSFRAHSKKELENKIKHYTDQQSAEQVAKKMEDIGLINDLEFSKTYAREFSSRKYYSKNRIIYELSRKGVEKSIILEAISDIDIDEDENIKSFINHKRYGNLKDEKVRRRAVSALQRLGYSWSQINGFINKDYED